MTHSALAVGLDRGTMRHFLSRAGSGNLEVECVAQAQQAATMAWNRRYELVACAYPLPDMVMREFCRTVRHPDSASRDTALLVLCLPDMQAEAKRALPSGRTLVRSRHDNGPLIHEAIVHLLRVAPRRSLDVPIELSPLDDDDCSIAARLVNLSKSGMLISHPDRPRVGTSLSLHLLHRAGRRSSIGYRRGRSPHSYGSRRGRRVRHADHQPASRCSSTDPPLSRACRLIRAEGPQS